MGPSVGLGHIFFRGHYLIDCNISPFILPFISPISPLLLSEVTVFMLKSKCATNKAINILTLYKFLSQSIDKYTVAPQ